MRTFTICNAVLLFTVLFLAATAPAFADTLDQTFIGGVCCAFFAPGLGNPGTSAVGQTFTAGLTGVLTGVNIDVTTFQSTIPLHIAIHTVSGGVPTNTVLGSTDLAAGQSAPISLLVTFPQTINVAQGSQYAIVISYPGGPLFNPDPFSTPAAIWVGLCCGVGDHYSGGGALIFVQSTGQWVSPAGSADLFFQTYVDTTQVEPVPEPGTLLLLGTGLAGLGAALRRRFVP